MIHDGVLRKYIFSVCTISSYLLIMVAMRLGFVVQARDKFTSLRKSAKLDTVASVEEVCTGVYFMTSVHNIVSYR